MSGFPALQPALTVRVSTNTHRSSSTFNVMILILVFCFIFKIKLGPALPVGSTAKGPGLNIVVRVFMLSHEMGKTWADERGGNQSPCLVAQSSLSLALSPL
jgi:hypothetical protein